VSISDDFARETIPITSINEIERVRIFFIVKNLLFFQVKKAGLPKRFLIFGNPAVPIGIGTRGFALTSQSGSRKFGMPSDYSELAFVGFFKLIIPTAPMDRSYSIN